MEQLALCNEKKQETAFQTGHNFFKLLKNRCFSIHQATESLRTEFMLHSLITNKKIFKYNLLQNLSFP